MVKSITPRGVGRPDNEREVHRSAIPTPRSQLPYSYAQDFSTNTFEYIKITPDIPEGYRLIIRKIIVSIHQNALIGVGIKLESGIYIANGLGYKIVEVPIYPGYINQGETFEIVVHNIGGISEIDGSITVLGLYEYVGV